MSLRVREGSLSELMDDPDCDPRRLRRTLRGFAAVNPAVARWGAVYRSHVLPALAAARGPVRLLDIGCGGGDVLRRLIRIARRDGFDASGLGIDPDPRAIEVAEEAAGVSGVEYRRASSRELVAEGARFDVVCSNHLLHHLDDAALDEVLEDSRALASGCCVHSDIARGRIAYAAFAIASAPLAPGTFLRVDGLRSIRRSYTHSELEARLPPGWSAEQPGRFRLLAVHRARPR